LFSYCVDHKCARISEVKASTYAAIAFIVPLHENDKGARVEPIARPNEPAKARIAFSGAKGQRAAVLSLECPIDLRGQIEKGSSLSGRPPAENPTPADEYRIRSFDPPGELSLPRLAPPSR